MPMDPRVDRYIEDAPAFAQPILEHIRKLVHKACPEAEETLKWRQPCFLYRNKILCGMSAFKAHCNCGFWDPDIRPVLVNDGVKTHAKVGLLEDITKLSDLPSARDMLRYIREACRIREAKLLNPASPKPAKPRKPEAEVPRDLAAALAGNRAASQAFHRFSPSHRREYIEWIAEAKRDETRQKRIATALEWLAEGKPRNWKYMNC
jgi:uncharacterized protein YdeI (YjbR/CyaY-like superfamily)